MTKVRVGYDESYFLDSEGSVWVCGENYSGQSGLGHAESPNKNHRFDEWVGIEHIDSSQIKRKVGQNSSTRTN